MSKYFWKFQVLLWFSVCVLVNFSANGFNLSPNPIQVFTEPYLRTYMPKVRSSYFGFSIVLQHDNIIVGAPRAQSSIEAQRNINETGAIYKCNIQSGSCAPFIFDREGNTHIENSEYSYDSEKKDFQWLGGSMDGGPKGTDRLVVCAPRRLADLPNDYLVHGVCFWTSDTRSTSPLYPQKIAPLRLKNKQVLEEKGKNYFYHMFGEQGISVHLTEDNEEIIIGAPGIHTWKGSIIRYKKKAVTDIGGFSRRNSRDTRGKRQAYEYKSEVPNPSLWEQPNDSYFGYAVTSGFFEHPKTNKLFYVATAPQADQQSGEAYIFDVKKSEGDEHKIEIYQKFRGTQFGEYFGYSVLAEDLNGDSMTDLIITAPQYAESLNYEKGAVYTFINKGGLYFERTILIGPSDKPARFGTTLGKLGDINHDGFNDVAISAPFEDDGVVYIYLGSEKGLREKPSQILKPTSMPSTVPSQMFGHGISKGVDIDNNEFNDLAIGAPNSDKVYLFKSYPVVKIVASINPLTRALSINNQTKIQMRACYRIDTTSTKVYQQDLAIKIVADNQIKRVKLSSGSNKMEFTDTATKIDKCRLIDADVRLSLPDIFKPIDIQMSYELLNKFSDQQGFCDGCAAVDPIDAASDSQKIVFSTGCKNEICEADLKLKSSGLQSSSYIIGSSRTISITYEITNAGETAYLPQINITSSNEMPFAKIPSSCKADNFVLLCNLNEGGPMGTGKKDTLVIVFDTTDIDGESMEIIAEVSSAGNERNNDDNFATNSITLREFSTIEAIGQPISPAINLEKTSGTATIMNHFEIQNTGPSKVKEMEVSLLLPISYMIPNSQNRIPLIDFSNITINATYNNNPIKVDFYQDNIILIQNAVEVSSTPSAIAENVEDPNFSSYNVGNFISQGNGISVDEFSNTQPMARRRRAAEEQAINNEYARIAEKVVELNDDLLGKFPVNRTIIFDCSNTAETICIKAVLKVANFYPGSSHLSIDFKYNIDLGEVDRLLVEPKEFFIVTTALNISKIGDERRDTIQLKKTDPHNIISKHQIYTTPIWVYILAILGGLLLLVVITYGLYKAGFFRRTKKEELEKLTRETYQNAEDTEDEN